MTYLNMMRFLLLCRQVQTCLSKILEYVLFTCWLGYIVSVLSRSFSLYCAYMMESSKGANQRSNDTNFILRRLEGANSRPERVNSNTV